MKYRVFTKNDRKINVMCKNIKILFLILFTSLSVYAQDPQLLENDWHLQKVVVDGEEYLPPLPNAEIQSILTIYGADGFLTSMCNDLSGPVTYTNQDFIFTEALTITLGSCNLNVNYEFEQLYFGVYFDNESFPFEYAITNGGNNILSLTIIGQNDDQAIYNNTLLANPTFNNLSLKIYPNPIKDVMNIQIQNSEIIKSIKVFNVLGKLVIEEKGDVNQLDVSLLKSGLFLIKIETNKGIFVKKIMKK